jgi:hypothetical protein
MRTATSGSLIVVAFVLASPGLAQERRPPAPRAPATLEDLDKTKRLDDLQSLGENIMTLATKIVREKRSQCLRAFGDPEFCGCLSEELPVGASFIHYLQVVTTAKEELEDAKLSKDDKQLVDKIVAAREVCVLKAHGGHRR